MNPSEDELILPGTQDDATDAQRPVRGDRLWAPWRMKYVGGSKTEAGCILCNRLAETDDLRSLILHRGDRAYVIMNLYPYNTGHTMIVPVEHVASPETADPAALAEMSSLRPPLLRATRRALSCDGFNLGLNIGTVAGAGIADHLHEHVVPRWTGDANFMPILATTMVLPELIPVTYAKLRSELVREMTGICHVHIVLFADGDRAVLVDQEGAVPRSAAAPEEAIWRNARAAIPDIAGCEAQLVAWAGEVQAGPGINSLAFRGDAHLDPRADVGCSWRWQPVATAMAGPSGRLVATALANLAR